MSQRANASEPEPSSTYGVPYSTENPRQIESGSSSRKRSLNETEQKASPNPSISDPSPAAEQSSRLQDDRSDPRPLRSIGVHSILNPSEPEQLEASNPRHRITNVEPFFSTKSKQSYKPVSGSTAPVSTELGVGRVPPSTETHYAVQDRVQRRVLTPKSRAASLGRINPPVATIDAQKSPFLPSESTNPVVSGATDVPLMPAPSTNPRYPLGFPQPSTSIRAPSGRRVSIDTAQDPLSRSVSPSTSYSSFSQQSQTSPAMQYGPSVIKAGVTYNPPPYHTQSDSQEAPALRLASERPFSSAVPSLGQSNYQLMTLDTDQGPIQVPVDTQAASKMADEKRKRNAGASARFRQRRKEKEKEAGHTIGKLEQQVRDLTEDTDFYRRERDFFRHMLFSAPGQAVIPPRPLSPRLQRIRRLSSGDSTTSNTQWQEENMRGEMERNTRRRISSFSPGYSLPPPSAIIAPSIPSAGYGPPSAFARPSRETRIVSAGRGIHQASLPRTESYDPFPQNQNDSGRHASREGQQR